MSPSISNRGKAEGEARTPRARRRSAKRTRSLDPTTPRTAREARDAQPQADANATQGPREATTFHTRLLQCALAVEESRSYWQRVSPAGPRPSPSPSPSPSPERAFEEFWFGAKSLAWVKVLLLNLRARFDAFPPTLAVLSAWRGMPPDVRALVCHWHLQLADPLYRAFSGTFLPDRVERPKNTFRQTAVLAWIKQHGPEHWTLGTRKKLASRLVSSALSAGLVAGRRDPRTARLPSVPEVALEYAFELLRRVEFEGTMLENPYLRSVGLSGTRLEDRLRGLPTLGYRRVGNVIEYGSRYDGLVDWALGRGVCDPASLDAAALGFLPRSD